MKAAVFTRYGSPEELHLKEVEQPVPKDDEVLVRIHATTVNSGDLRLRKADPVFIRLFFGLFRPGKKILGFTFSGMVAATGNKVTRFKTGDAVLGVTGFGFGAWAEYKSVREPLLVLKPGNISHEAAAAIPFGGNTALYYLRKAGIHEGQKILIYGASGSTGTMAVQLAKYFGAGVTAVCSTDNVEMVRSLGPDTIIDYKKEDIAAGDTKYDIVFDAVGKLSHRKARKLLLPDATYITVNKGLAKVSNENLELLKDLAATGAIKPVIDKSWPLEQIVEANRYGDLGRKKGNIVITVGQGT
ncbi:MAG: zinc-binding dehydrogenase [Terrimonas sp.]|nr:zinc-binding dehydrogenase [Terrimonas sp.]